MITNSLTKIQEDTIFKNRILHVLYPELSILKMSEDIEATAACAAGHSEEQKEH